MTLILGRFQPLHRGHLKVIKDSYEEDPELIIAIGSSWKKDEKRNPFTAEERRLMLEKTIGANSISADIVLVPDIPCDGTYANHVERFIGKKPDKVITENQWTFDLFQKAGYDVHLTPRYFGISSTDIRRRIAAGEDWKDLVPPEVTGIIDDINGSERIRTIFQR